MAEFPAPRIESHARLGDVLGIELMVARDDLLPFPLAGNKARKLDRELAFAEPGEVLLSNGGVDSNHCRTLAFYGARLGMPVHLVLHGEPGDGVPALRLLDLLGASYDVVRAGDLAAALDRAEWRITQSGRRVRRIAGGCHTPAGALAYRDAGRAAIAECRPEVIVVASGTGATHGGLHAAAVGTATSVIGISVAREAARGAAAVSEAAEWAGAGGAAVQFRDEFRDGGYGRYGARTEAAVALGWAYGLPLDPTYTGKAFAAVVDARFRARSLAGRRVLFWHTGGLMNAISAGAAGDGGGGE